MMMRPFFNPPMEGYNIAPSDNFAIDPITSVNTCIVNQAAPMPPQMILSPGYQQQQQQPPFQLTPQGTLTSVNAQPVMAPQGGGELTVAQLQQMQAANPGLITIEHQHHYVQPVHVVEEPVVHQVVSVNRSMLPGAPAIAAQAMPASNVPVGAAAPHFMVPSGAVGPAQPMIPAQGGYPFVYAATTFPRGAGGAQ